MLTPSRAYEIASDFGSYMRAGDPGAVFYSFRVNDARPTSEQHRAQALTYCESLIAEQPDAPDLIALSALRAFFQQTECRA